MARNTGSQARRFDALEAEDIGADAVLEHRDYQAVGRALAAGS
jgi:hypothetical protein